MTVERGGLGAPDRDDERKTVGGVVEPYVFDAEIVEDSPGEAAPRPLAVARGRAVQVVTTLGGTSAGAAAARHARRGARAGWTIGQGVVSWGRRAGMAATHGHLREQVRLARQSGDRVGLAEWSDRLQAARDARQRRMRELPAQILAVLWAAGVVLALVAGAVVVGGIGAATRDGGADWRSWWAGVGATVAALGDVAVLAWWLVWLLVWPVMAVLAWREGRRVADPPLWLLTPAEKAHVGSEITADVIAAAFGAAKVKVLAKYLKRGGRIEFIVPPREQGGGTYFRVRFPVGVSAAEFLPSAKVELVAGNLSRHKHEYWPQKDPETDARTLDCWVADKGALDRPAPPWPLLDEGSFDVFRDRLPWGVTMRSEQVSVGMLQKHWLIGATSKQGKTTAVRVLLLGLALDVTVELRIADLKGDGDFAMFKGIAEPLIEGQAEEDAEAACVMLEDAVAEMQLRYDRKRQLGIVGPITRELSRRPGSGFHPIYVVVDECQVLYAAPHPIGGSKDDARAWRAAKRLHDQARAVNIHLVQATQRPDDRTLPARVREGAHVRGALNVPNEAAAKMILADAAERGARPQDLRAGRDAGTVVATGEIEDIPAGQAFVIVRTHYVTTKQAYTVAERALAERTKHGRLPEPAAALTAELERKRDHLADVEEVLRGEPRLRTTTVLGRLAELDPAVYTDWTHGDLARELMAEGVPVRKFDGLKVVRADDVGRALDVRSRDPQGVPSDD